mgnify:CR=1 FL=1
MQARPPLTAQGTAGDVFVLSLAPGGGLRWVKGFGQLQSFERTMLLEGIDYLWRDHLKAMDHLRGGIGLRGYGQRNPLLEYKKEGFEMFGMMMELWDERAVGRIYQPMLRDALTENTVRHLGQAGAAQRSPAEAAWEAAHEVARPVMFAILIIVVVFLPLFALQSMEGRMFKPLAMTMIFALIGSLLASLIVVPALGALIEAGRASAQDIDDFADNLRGRVAADGRLIADRFRAR